MKVYQCSPDITNSTFTLNAHHGLYTSGNSNPVITDNTFYYNASHGLYAFGTAPAIIDNNFEDNGGYAVMFHEVSRIMVCSGNAGSDNDVNGIGLNGALNSDSVLSGTFPFVLTDTLLVGHNTTLTVDAGTVIKSEAIGLLYVKGTLEVNGTSHQPVIFTSLRDDTYGGDTDDDPASPSSGDWYGIYLCGYDTSGIHDGMGQFEWCIIRYGGGAGSGFDANVYFNQSNSGNFTNSISELSADCGLRIYRCSPEVTNSTFALNASQGIHISGNSFPAIASSIFSQNTSHGLYASGFAPIIADNSFEGNDGYAVMLNDVSRVTDCSGNTGSDNGINGIGLNGTLSSDSVLSGTFPFVLSGKLSVDYGATLTVDAGAVIKGESTGLLNVKGTLDVNGTSHQPVIFTSLRDDTYGGDTDGIPDSPAPGDWYGIHLCGRDEHGIYDGIGQLERCILRYGGGSNSIPYHNVYFNKSRSGNLTNSVSEYSGNCGVQVYDCSPVFRGNRIENNTSYGVYITGGGPDLGTNDPSDKGANAILDNDSGDYQVYNVSSNAISAHYNYWVYTTAAEIDAHIYDDNENKNSGKVLFHPWLPGDTSGVIRYHALLVGSGAWYNGRDGYLEAIASSDVSAVRGFLTAFGLNWSSDRIASLVNEQVSRDAIEDAMDAAGLQMDGDDVLLLYYSGQGSLDGLSLFSGHTFSPSDLRSALDSYIPQGSKAVIVLNASHSGAFVSEFNAEGRANTFILSSCGPDEDAACSGWIPDHPWGVSLFSWHFCQAVAGMGDSDADCMVSNDEAYDYVNGRIITAGSVHPQNYAGTGMGGFAMMNITLAPKMIIQAFSPVDLVVEGPEGRLIGKDVITMPSANYIEADLNGDSSPDDAALISEVQFGGYSIEVTPESGADPTDTYTLDVVYNGESTILAEGVEIQSIPDEPYIFFFSQYNMEPGWNLISVPVQSPDNDLDIVLQSIAGHYASVWAYKAASDEWERYFAIGPGFLSDLGTIDPGKGYWILMDDFATLDMNGQVTDEAIPLSQGWNLVGYNCLKVKSVTDALSSIAEDCNSAWAYDAVSNEWERYVANGPESRNNLTEMGPGKGYWINAADVCTWDVNATAPSTAPPMALEFRRNNAPHDKPEIPYTIWGEVETDVMNITSRYRPTVLLKVNDEIRSSCRLRTTVGHQDFYVLDVPLTADDSAQLYIQMGDTIMKAAPVPPGKPGQIIRLDLSVRMSPEASLLHQNFPNPFNPDTWIPYQLRGGSHVEISIYTSIGQLVRRLNLGYQPAGFYTSKEKAAYWDGMNEAGEQVANGIYFYSIKAASLTATRKMIMVK